MGRKLLTLFLFVVSSGQLVASHVADFAGLFTYEQKEILEEVCVGLQKRHRLMVTIRIYPDSIYYDDLAASKSELDEFLYIHIGLGENRVVTKTANSQNEEFFSNVLHQWVEINLQEGRDIFDPLQSALADIDREYTLFRQLEDHEYEWTAPSEEEWTPRTGRFVRLCFFAIVLLVIRFTVKNFRSGNSFENVEFYGLSRMTRGQIIAVAAALILFAFRLVRLFPYEEMGVILIMYSLAFYPFMAAAAGVIMWAVDGVRIMNAGGQRAPLSLGEKLYLIRPHASTEQLMEMNFYQLVYEKRINLRLQTVRLGYREVDHYSVQKGESPAAPIRELKDLQVFVDHLPLEETDLEKYLNDIYNSFGRFKAFRKDFLLYALVDRGLHVKWLWPFNLFIRTPLGSKVRAKTSKIVARQSELVDLATNHPERCEKYVSHLDLHVFLIDSFERRLDELYNVLFDWGKLPAIPAKLKDFFDPSFSFRYFNRKLRSAYYYESAWGSWNDDDDWD